ncbi:MAG: hypothetical protein SWZ49_22830 [Cyanobacteriota bacterium]|nr:hypothetical protein [Cyanobacteriota bacterium]
MWLISFSGSCKRELGIGELGIGNWRKNIRRLKPLLHKQSPPAWTIRILTHHRGLKLIYHWISQNTDFKKLINLLIHTENEESSYSDLIYLQSFLSVTEWLYTFRRDFYVSDEHDISLLISRNSQIIKEIDIFRQQQIVNLNDLYSLGLHSHYDLLGCF